MTFRPRTSEKLIARFAATLASMCDTVVVVDGSRVLFAKNSDRDPNEAQLLEWHPGRQHERGSTLRCTWIEIEQAPLTHAVMISRPFWMWGAEMGANEHGVAIGNEAVFTREPYAAMGLTGMDLLRLALERATSAEEAVNTMTELLERYGQGGGCGYERRGFTYHNSFAVADPARAFILESAGQRWAVEEVHEGVRSISNGLTIPGFAERYGDRIRTKVAACGVRRAESQRTASADPSPAGLMATLRSHGSSRWPAYSLANGAMDGPCVHAGGRLVSTQTTASWVAELRPDHCAHWTTATAAPCLSLFKPVRVTEPLDLGVAPGDRFDTRALWWRHERLHRRSIGAPQTAEGYLRERDELERAWLSCAPEPVEAFAQGDELLARWDPARGPRPDGRPWFVRRLWHERDRRAGLLPA